MNDEDTSRSQVVDHIHKTMLQSTEGFIKFVSKLFGRPMCVLIATVPDDIRELENPESTFLLTNMPEDLAAKWLQRMADMKGDESREQRHNLNG